MKMKFITIILLLIINNNSINGGTLKSKTYINEKRMHSSEYLNNKSNNVKADEATASYWINLAKQHVTQQTNRLQNRNIAKNIIFFLGDGLSIPTLAATRVYVGGEHIPLSFEQFPSVGMAKTYCVDMQVPDSGCTATAYLTGVKGNYETIGVNGKVKFNDCGANLLDKSTHSSSIANWAMDADKVAGIITNMRVTHASPAGIYAHISNRDWETDDDISYDGCNPNQIDDIAEQLINGDGKNLRVILGGGRRSFIDSTALDEENFFGYRSDGKNLIDEWLNNNNYDGTAKTRYVWNKSDFLNVNPDETDHLLGLFASSHLRYNLDNQKIESIDDREPSLTEMTVKAIDILNKNDKGFFLFVEGGLIDYAHHDNFARMSIDETAEFSKAIAAAVAKVNLTETLIIVTSDHSHPMTMAGYPDRGEDIFGVAGISDMDNLPYMTLSYSNGPGYNNNFNETIGRIDLRTIDTDYDEYNFPATVYNLLDEHAGDDVPVFAIGPWSHLFTGVYEQSYIPQMIGYAACIGEGLHACTY